MVADSDLLNVKLWNISSANKQENTDFVPYNGNFWFVDRALRYLSGNKTILPSVKKTKVKVLPLNMALKLMAEQIYEEKRQKINEMEVEEME